MQKVVRSSLAAILSLAALTACGDKVTVAAPTTAVVVVPHITQVQVSGPTSYSLGTVTNDSLSFGATIVADPGFAGARAVTWTSSNPAVLRITAASTNNTTGNGKALAAGSAVITATSSVDGVSGSLSVTVLAGAGTGAPASIVISAINQGANGPPGSVLGANVDLGNAGGEIDVTTSVSFTPANRPSAVTLTLTNTTTNKVATCESLPFGGSGAASLKDIAPVVLSCRTAAFDTTTGIAPITNGTYTMSASLQSGSTQSSTSAATTAITINNADFVRVGIVGTTAAGTDHPTASAVVNGAVWKSGSITVKALPVMYTAGRTVTAATVNLVNASAGPPGLGQPDVGALAGPGAPNTVIARSVNNGAADVIPCGTAFATQTSPAVFSPTFTFSGTDSLTLAGVENVMADTLIATVAATDANGNSVTRVTNSDANLTALTVPAVGCGGAVSTAVTLGNFIRFDNRRPSASQWDPRVVAQGANDMFAEQGINAAWLGQNITFPTVGNATAALAIAGNGLLLGADAGAGNQTVVYQVASAAAAPAKNAAAGWTTITCTTAPCTPVTAAAVLAASPSVGTYWIRIITKDALGNADTTRISLNANSGCPVACGSILAPISDATPATFGVDIVAPTGSLTVASGRIPGAIISSVACTMSPYPGNGQATATNVPNNPFSCAAPSFTAAAGAAAGAGAQGSQGLNGGVLAFQASDPQNPNGVNGSLFGLQPMIVWIRQIVPSAVSNALAVVNCVNATSGAITLAPANDQTCLTTATRQPVTFSLPASVVNGGGVALQGEYTVFYQIADEANNRQATATIAFTVDNTPPTVGATAGPVIPSSITGTTTLTTQGGTFADNEDVVGANGLLTYPNVGGAPLSFITNATTTVTGVVQDATLTRVADVVGSMVSTGAPFLETVWLFGDAVNGGKPNQLGLRARDGAQNLSLPFNIALPASNIAGPAANPFPSGGANDFQAFTFTATPTPITVTGTGGTRLATLQATVTALPTSFNSPFTQVCFYWAHNSAAQLGASGAGENRGSFSGPGEYNFISCTSTASAVVTGGGPPPAGNRLYTYAAVTFTPPVNMGGTAWAGGITFRAIGVNAAGDGLSAVPVTIAVN